MTTSPRTFAHTPQLDEACRRAIRSRLVQQLFAAELERCLRMKKAPDHSVAQTLARVKKHFWELAQ